MFIFHRSGRSRQDSWWGPLRAESGPCKACSSQRDHSSTSGWGCLLQQTVLLAQQASLHFFAPCHQKEKRRDLAKSPGCRRRRAGEGRVCRNWPWLEETLAQLGGYRQHSAAPPPIQTHVINRVLRQAQAQAPLCIDEAQVGSKPRYWARVACPLS